MNLSSTIGLYCSADYLRAKIDKHRKGFKDRLLDFETRKQDGYRHRLSRRNANVPALRPDSVTGVQPHSAGFAMFGNGK